MSMEVVNSLQCVVGTKERLSAEISAEIQILERGLLVRLMTFSTSSLAPCPSWARSSVDALRRLPHLHFFFRGTHGPFLKKRSRRSSGCWSRSPVLPASSSYCVCGWHIRFRNRLTPAVDSAPLVVRRISLKFLPLVGYNFNLKLFFAVIAFFHNLCQSLLVVNAI